MVSEHEAYREIDTVLASVIYNVRSFDGSILVDCVELLADLGKACFCSEVEEQPMDIDAEAEDGSSTEGVNHLSNGLVSEIGECVLASV